MIKCSDCSYYDECRYATNGEILFCGNERPKRKVLCQLKKGHKGSCQAVIFWEKNK